LIRISKLSIDFLIKEMKIELVMRYLYTRR